MFSSNAGENALVQILISTCRKFKLTFVTPVWGRRQGLHPLKLPTEVTFGSVLSAMAMDDGSNPLSIEVSDRAFIRPGGLALLCCWLLDARRRGGRDVHLAGPQTKLDHMVRLGLYEHLALDHIPLPSARPVAGRYIPLRLVSTGNEVLPVTNAICDLMLRHYDDAAQFVPAVEWMTYEVIDNIVLHSQAALPGAICAHFYQGSGVLEIAVVDFGRGLRASLSEGHTVADDAAALSLAITRGVTRNREIGQGNGVAGTHEIARVNGGEFVLCSGNSMLSQRGETGRVDTVPRMPGTAVVLSLDTRKPVDLRATWIGSGTADWNYLNVEGERLVAKGGMRIGEECSHVAGREPARSLRRKIEGLLPALEAPLVLDFTGIRMASSSFLDELLGRLVTTYGVDVLGSKIQVVNMDPLVQGIAESAIAQRVESAK
jgi:anti-sigma regulatory factor (Ser/Thr protein kinase)